MVKIEYENSRIWQPCKYSFTNNNIDIFINFTAGFPCYVRYASILLKVEAKAIIRHIPSEMIKTFPISGYRSDNISCQWRNYSEIAIAMRFLLPYHKLKSYLQFFFKNDFIKKKRKIMKKSALELEGDMLYI